MTKAERFAYYAKKANKLIMFKFPNSSLTAEVGVMGNLEFNMWPHIDTKHIPAFMDWLHETFVRQVDYVFYDE